MGSNGEVGEMDRKKEHVRVCEQVQMQETDLDKIYSLGRPQMGRVSSCQSRMVLDKRGIPPSVEADRKCSAKYLK